METGARPTYCSRMERHLQSCTSSKSAQHVQETEDIMSRSRAILDIPRFGVHRLSLQEHRGGSLRRVQWYGDYASQRLIPIASRCDSGSLSSRPKRAAASARTLGLSRPSAIVGFDYGNSRFWTTATIGDASTSLQIYSAHWVFQSLLVASRPAPSLRCECRSFAHRRVPNASRLQICRQEIHSRC